MGSDDLAEGLKILERKILTALLAANKKAISSRWNNVHPVFMDKTEADYTDTYTLATTENSKGLRPVPPGWGSSGVMSGGSSIMMDFCVTGRNLSYRKIILGEVVQQSRSISLPIS